MRVKFPQILCFQEWYELYKLPDTKKTDKWDKLSQPMESLSETPFLNDTRMKVLNLLEKHKKAVEEIELAMVIYSQIYTSQSPSVYLAYLKDSKTALEYLTAKTFLPMMSGKKKEIRIYIGSKLEFPDHTDVKVKQFARKKMRDHLKSKLTEIIETN